MGIQQLMMSAQPAAPSAIWTGLFQTGSVDNGAWVGFTGPMCQPLSVQLSNAPVGSLSGANTTGAFPPISGDALVAVFDPVNTNAGIVVMAVANPALYKSFTVNGLTRTVGVDGTYFMYFSGNPHWGLDTYAFVFPTLPFGVVAGLSYPIGIELF